MSLVTINEAKNLRYGFDVEGIVKNMSYPRYVNLKNGDVALVSDAKLSDGFGNLIKVSFWNDDIKKIRNNLKIRIKNVYTKIFRGDTILYKSKNGSIDILNFNPDQIFDDIEKFIQDNKDIKSLSQYYNFVKYSKYNIYLGAKRSDYLLIIKAFIAIENARKRQAKRNSDESSAICYLHQTICLSPIRIQQILELFGIHISCRRILRISSDWNKPRFLYRYPKISYNVTREIGEKNSDEIYHLEITVDELPDEISIDDNYSNEDSIKPLCERSTLEFDRKYKGYHNFYEKPWNS